jgi:hypothetical protein
MTNPDQPRVINPGEPVEDQIVLRRCARCYAGFQVVRLESDMAENVVCKQCRAYYPYPLLQAAVKHQCSRSYDFYYALRLRTGEEIRFTQAGICGEYVALNGYNTDAEMRTDSLTRQFAWGVYVRASEIVRCAATLCMDS